MTAKEYLKQIELFDTKIRHRQVQLDELRILALGNTSQHMDKPQVQTSTNGDQLESDVIRYVDLANDIEKMIDYYVDLKEQVIREIHSLNDRRYIDILFKRYVEYKSYEDISKEMNYNQDWIRQLHKQALEDFYKKVLKNC